MFDKQAIGIISAFNKDRPDARFTDDDLRFAEAFGTRAALAVHLSERVARETVDAILEAQEAERSRIARELHDETGSALTAILLGLTAVDGAATLQEARQALAALRKNASSALENVGRLAFALRPPVLDEFGLAPALKDLSGSLEERGGPKVDLEIDLPAGTRLPAKLETAIFRVTQEALTNVVKHAEATTVRITLAWRERSVVLAVEDDGRGFSQEQRLMAGSDSSACASELHRSMARSRSNRRADAGTRIAVEIPSFSPREGARLALDGDAFEEVVECGVELLDAFSLEGGDDVVVVDAGGMQLPEYLLRSLEFRLEPAFDAAVILKGGDRLLGHCRDCLGTDQLVHIEGVVVTGVLRRGRRP